MNELLQLVAQNSVLLSVGTTLLLSLGTVAVWFCKSPVHRQRISELTIAGVLAWIVLALFPLPRLLPDWFSRDHQPAVETREAAPNSENATEPDGFYSESTVPAIKIPTDGPVLLPDVTDAAGDEEIVEDAEKVAGIEMPLLIPSPSEELPPLHSEVNPPIAVVQPSTAIPSPWQFDFQKLAGLCTGAYLAGTSLSLLSIVAGYLLLLRIRRTAEAPPQWLANELQSLARQTGIAPPRLIVSRLCARPITWGVLWPVVVLPHSLCRQENTSQLRTILLHELGHIAQQDSQGNLLFCVALPLLYSHPLYWWLRRDSQLAAELVADDWAAWQTGKETYVEELVALARCTGRSSLPLVGVTGLFSSPSQFYRRMQMLLAREKPLSTRTSLPWRLASLSALAGSVVLAASLAGVRPAAGQAAPAADPPPTVKPATEATPLPPRAEPTTPATAVPATPLGVPMSLPAVAAPVVPGSPPEFRSPPATLEVPATPANPLSPEEAVLLREIRLLQEKLRVLEAQRGDKARAVGGKVAVQPGANQIKIVRTDEKGIMSIETWTTDEKGQPAKILSKTSVAGPAPSAVAFSADGKIITKEFTNPDGSRVTQIVDGATGKVIAENHTGATARRITNRDDVLPSDTKPGKPIVSPRVEYPTPILPGTSAETRTTVTGPQKGVFAAPAGTNPSGTLYAEPANVPSVARGSQQLDLVSLANSYTDAISAREAAAAKMADIERLHDSKVVSQQEVTAAKLALSAADRKEQLLRKIAEVALESAAQEVEIATALYKSGNATVSAAGEAKTRLAILKQILGTTKPAEVTPPKP